MTEIARQLEAERRAEATKVAKMRRKELTENIIRKELAKERRAEAREIAEERRK